MAAPKVWLKANHCLKGKDVLPVALRLRALYGTSPQDLASLSKKHSLESYSKEELAIEFKRLTGHEIEVRYLYFHIYVYLGPY